MIRQLRIFHTSKSYIYIYKNHLLHSNSHIIYQIYRIILYSNLCLYSYFSVAMGVKGATEENMSPFTLASTWQFSSRREDMQVFTALSCVDVSSWCICMYNWVVEGLCRRSRILYPATGLKSNESNDTTDMWVSTPWYDMHWASRSFIFFFSTRLA